jgi:hypothetical protein
MRIALAAVLLAACSGSGTDLDENEQGVCSNLAPDACRTNPQCQLAYEDSGFQPSPFFMHCLALEDFTTTGTDCSTMGRDGCRSRHECSPIFWQDLGPDDGPVGDPYYKSCTNEADLDDLTSAQGACSNLAEDACRSATSCQSLYVVAGGSAGPRFERCLEVATPAAASSSCPQDRTGCRTRPDCASVFEQAKGPSDGNVGDPFYLRCDLEATIESI